MPDAALKLANDLWSLYHCGVMGLREKGAVLIRAAEKNARRVVLEEVVDDSKQLAHIIVESAVICEPSVGAEGVLVKTWTFDEAVVEEIVVNWIRARIKEETDAERTE